MSTDIFLVVAGTSCPALLVVLVERLLKAKDGVVLGLCLLIAEVDGDQEETHWSVFRADSTMPDGVSLRWESVLSASGRDSPKRGSLVVSDIWASKTRPESQSQLINYGR